jgi:hypothetical protein
MSLVRDILTVGGIDQETIARLESMLEQSADAVQHRRPHDMGGGLFGGLPTGVDLDSQTQLAHQHIREALDELVAGLRGYGANIRKYAADMSGTDDDVQARMQTTTQTVTALAGCTTSGDFHLDNTCAAPEAGSGGEG